MLVPLDHLHVHAGDHLHAHAWQVQALWKTGCVHCGVSAITGYFRREQAPNVLLTTCYRPSRLMYAFLADMLEVLPCATFYKRQASALYYFLPLSC
jgi:hypothetical protein